MIKPTVWLQTGMIIIYGSSLDAASHRHHAIQIVWPQDNSPCQLNGNDIAQLLLINSQVEHQLQMSRGWIVLIEPNSALGHALSIELAGQPVKAIDSVFFSSSKPPTPNADVTKLLAPLFDKLALLTPPLPAHNIIKDHRIAKLINELDQCLAGACLKPSSWRAHEVANQLALSESRFLHLFSKQLGIAWRPYLLWRRMNCAVYAMKNNRSATDAAHSAGFSDSAHLSRTFRDTFGMSIRQARTLFKTD